MRATWSREYEGLLTVLGTTDLTILSGIGTNDGWRFEVRGENQEAITTFRDHHTNNDSINIEAIHALQPIQGDSYELTETQREALIVAYERGYFDWPRESSLEEIAAELDITQQSLSSRLRRGHRRLISRTLIPPNGQDRTSRNSER